MNNLKKTGVKCLDSRTGSFNWEYIIVPTGQKVVRVPDLDGTLEQRKQSVVPAGK